MLLGKYGEILDLALRKSAAGAFVGKCLVEYKKLESALLAKAQLHQRHRMAGSPTALEIQFDRPPERRASSGTQPQESANVSKTSPNKSSHYSPGGPQMPAQITPHTHTSAQMGPQADMAADPTAYLSMCQD